MMQMVPVGVRIEMAMIILRRLTGMKNIRASLPIMGTLIRPPPSSWSHSCVDRIHESYLSGIGDERDLVRINRDCWWSSEAVQPSGNPSKMSLGEENHFAQPDEPGMRISPGFPPNTWIACGH